MDAMAAETSEVAKVANRTKAEAAERDRDRGSIPVKTGAGPAYMVSQGGCGRGGKADASAVHVLGLLQIRERAITIVSRCASKKAHQSCSERCNQCAGGDFRMTALNNSGTHESGIPMDGITWR